MSRAKLFVVLVVLAVFVAIPASASVVTSEPESLVDVTLAGSKLCVPKKPITCRAEGFTAIPDFSNEAKVETPEPVKAQAVSSIDVQSVFQTEAFRSLTKPQMQYQEARLCMPPRWLCRFVELITGQEETE